MPTAASARDIRPHARLGMAGGPARSRWLALLRGRRLTRRPLDVVTTAAFVAGGALLVASGAVHFHLWGEADGYRSIPTIGTLFLLQAIAGLVVGVGVIAVRRVWAALIGVGFAVATMGGFLLSVTNGLFGFKDSWLAPFAKEAFVVELAAAGVLALAGTLCLVGSAPRARTGSTPAGTAT